jgi:putative phosphoribosyl transferase
LPRGGVPVAFEIAKALGVPLELLLVRIRARRTRCGGYCFRRREDSQRRHCKKCLGISRETIEVVTIRETVALERREKLYRGDKPFSRLEGKIVIVVDDGIVIGATTRVAVKALRQYKSAKIIVTAPTSGPETYK